MTAQTDGQDGLISEAGQVPDHDRIPPTICSPTFIENKDRGRDRGSTTIKKTNFDLGGGAELAEGLAGLAGWQRQHVKRMSGPPLNHRHAGKLRDPLSSFFAVCLQ